VTRRPIRYHKCRACGHTFKSTELVIRGEPLRAAKQQQDEQLKNGGK
jgi:hypothetical protein